MASFQQFRTERRDTAKFHVIRMPTHFRKMGQRFNIVIILSNYATFARLMRLAVFWHAANTTF